MARIIKLETRLQRYKDQHEKLKAEVRKKLSWEDIAKRLLANDGYYLSRAQAMDEKGVLFGMDSLGNALIADSGENLTLTSVTYPEARDRVYFKNREQFEPTGYEMFPAGVDNTYSQELDDFIHYTGQYVEGILDSKHFVRGKLVETIGWLESSHHSLPRQIVNRNMWGYEIQAGNYQDRADVRRLLRVRRFW